jgi:NitT/TauT family transport system substrate-binding protein
MVQNARRSAAVRLTSLAAVALSAAVVVTGCSLLGGSSGSSSSSGSNSAGLEKTHLNVGMLNAIDVVPAWLAEDKGYFSQAGLTVNLQTVQGGSQSIPALVGGSLDIAFSNWGSMFSAQEKGVGDFRAIVDAYQSQEQNVLVTLPSSGIKSIKDLAGRTVSANNLTGTPPIAFKEILQSNGVDPNSVKLVTMGYGDVPAALANHQVDASILLEPYLSEVERSNGAVPVTDLFGPGPTQDMPIAGYMTLAKTAQNDPKTIAAFQRVMIKAQQECNSNPAEVQQEMVKHLKMDQQTADIVHIGSWFTSVSAARLQRVADLLTNFGVLKTKLDVSKLVVPIPSS